MVREEFGRTVKELGDYCRDLRKYFHDETVATNYFELAPSPQVIALAEAIYEVFFLLGQSVTSLPSSQKSGRNILNNENMRAIIEAIHIQREICGICSTHATEEDTLMAFERVDKACRDIPIDSFPVPREQEVPDQIYSDDPQVVNTEDSDELFTS